jgi:zinc/manganese transport system permease protein
MWEILAAPFAACLILTGIHCYLGIHVVMREVIFVDLALAQIAAMGAAVATLAGYDPHSAIAHATAMGFTFLGAAVFAVGRFRDRRVPQEAIIGIVYAVSSALTVLVLAHTAFGPEEIRHMLVGRLLFVGWDEVGLTALIYGGIAVVHVLLRRPFFAISRSAEKARLAGYRTRLWDFIFYVTFGVVVTSSVQIAGVLLVFSFLVVPAVCAMMFFGSVGPRLLMGWVLGMLASAGGLWASATWDLPTGASVVGMFGAIFAASAVVYSIVSAVRGPGSEPASRATEATARG